MSEVGLISEVWKLLKPNIETGDVDGAAETLVNFLVEEAHASTHEIKTTFRGDKEIKKALDFFIETPEDGLYHEEEDYTEFDDEDYYSDDLDDDY